MLFTGLSKKEKISLFVSRKKYLGIFENKWDTYYTYTLGE